jgi:prevent-host-death family protein
MVVTSTDFHSNLGKYLDMLKTNDITITRNGRKIAKLVNAEDDTLTEIHSLYGILAGSEFSKMTDDELDDVIRDERGKRLIQSPIL